jgi:hypothetical protein
MIHPGRAHCGTYAGHDQSENMLLHDPTFALLIFIIARRKLIIEKVLGDRKLIVL